jgi:hypothetical protein
MNYHPLSGHEICDAPCQAIVNGKWYRGVAVSRRFIPAVDHYGDESSGAAIMHYMVRCEDGVNRIVAFDAILFDPVIK